MSNKNSSKEILVENVDAFIDELFSMQKSGNYIFRGISNDNQFLPSLIRHYDDNFSASNIGVSEYERWILEQYGKYSIQYTPPYIHPLDWVASAQHFGVPTRLIDWTFDPFCALYFATWNDAPKNKIYKLLLINKDKHIYTDNPPIYEPDLTILEFTSNKLLAQYDAFANGLIEFNFNSMLLRMHSYGSIKSNFAQKIRLAKESEVKTGIHKLFFCSINDSNPRIIAQRGLFQIPRRFNLYQNEDYVIKDDIENGCEKIYIIPQKFRQSILTHLDRLNITTPRLFPDLQNICAYLKRLTPPRGEM